LWLATLQTGLCSNKSIKKEVVAPDPNKILFVLCKFVSKFH